MAKYHWYPLFIAVFLKRKDVLVSQLNQLSLSHFFKRKSPFFRACIATRQSVVQSVATDMP